MPEHSPKSHVAGHDEEQQQTSQWLEGLLDTLDRNPNDSPANPLLLDILREFPNLNDATKLLQYFFNTTDATYRILHRPTVWIQIQNFYAELEGNNLPTQTQLSFFLCIFAGSAYFAKDRFNFDTKALANRSQISLAERWARRAVALLLEPSLPPSLEALQTIMSLAHLCTQIEGLRGSYGPLSMLGLQMARSMHLHHLDSAANREDRRKNGANIIELEVKRRVWWHMVSSDW